MVLHELIPNPLIICQYLTWTSLISTWNSDSYIYSFGPASSIQELLIIPELGLLWYHMVLFQLYSSSHSFWYEHLATVTPMDSFSLAYSFQEIFLIPELWLSCSLMGFIQLYSSSWHTPISHLPTLTPIDSYGLLLACSLQDFCLSLNSNMGLFQLQSSSLGFIPKLISPHLATLTPMHSYVLGLGPFKKNSSCQHEENTSRHVRRTCRAWFFIMLHASMKKIFIGDHRSQRWTMMMRQRP